MSGYGCTRLNNEPFASEKGLKKHVTHAHGKAAVMLFVDEGAVLPAGAGAGAGSAANGDAFGEFQKVEKGEREVVEEEEEDDDFRVVIRSGPGGRSVRADKDATEMDTSDDEDDGGAAQTPPRRGRNITRFAAGVGAATEDGDVDSETLNREAIAAGRKRGSSALGSKLEQGRAKSARGERGTTRARATAAIRCGEDGVPPLRVQIRLHAGRPRALQDAHQEGDEHRAHHGGEAARGVHRDQQDSQGEGCGGGGAQEQEQGAKGAGVETPPRFGRPAPDESDSDAAEADDDEPQQPLLLQSSARNCTTCGTKRFKTQAELIKHMGDVHGVVAMDEEQYAAYRASNDAEDPAGGPRRRTDTRARVAPSLGHAGGSGAGHSWGADSWQVAAVAAAGNGALVHQPQYGAGDAGSGGQNVVIPADLVANMLERLQARSSATWRWSSAWP